MSSTHDNDSLSDAQADKFELHYRQQLSALVDGELAADLGAAIALIDTAQASAACLAVGLTGQQYVVQTSVTHVLDPSNVAIGVQAHAGGQVEGATGAPAEAGLQ